MERIAGLLGLSSVLLFCISLAVFGWLNPEFHYLNDFVSKLGAKEQPHAFWWNLIGFVTVGFLLIGFGIAHGLVIKDRLTGLFLALFGLGFAFTAIPIDFDNSESTVSKAHVVVICLALAFWLFGLARMSYDPAQDKLIRLRANVAAILLVGSMLGYAIGLWSMAITHRLVFAVVFGWTAFTSIILLRMSKSNKN